MLPSYNDLLVENLRSFAVFTNHSLVWNPRKGGFPWDLTDESWSQKIESLRYPVVKLRGSYRLVTRRHSTLGAAGKRLVACPAHTTLWRLSTVARLAALSSLLWVTSPSATGRTDQWVGSCHRPARLACAQPDPDPTRPSAIKRREAKSNIQLLQPVDNMNATVHIADEMPSATTATARPGDARNTDIKKYRGIFNRKHLYIERQTGEANFSGLMCGINRRGWRKELVTTVNVSWRIDSLQKVMAQSNM